MMMPLTPGVLLLLLTLVGLMPISFQFLEVPGIGISLSTVVFVALLVAVAMVPKCCRGPGGRGLVVLGIILWLGMTLSFIPSLFAGFDDLTPKQLLMPAYAGVWIGMMLVTAYLTSWPSVGRKVTYVLAGGIVFVAVLRCIEAFVFHRIGSANAPTLMTQNNYGLQFSCFTAFAITLALYTRGSRRALMLAAVAILLAAIMLNGSRSSWIAVTVGLIVIFIGTMQVQRKVALGAVAAMVSLVGLSVVFMVVVNPGGTIERALTFKNLEGDKSYMARVVMNRKAMTLFKQHPLTGVGYGKFSETWADLDMPDVLRHKSQTGFNTKNAHNGYLSLLAETGIVGTIPFAGLLVILLFYGGYAVWIDLRAHQNVWALASYAAFVSMSIHLWTIAGLTSSGAWVVYGLAMGSIIRHRRIKNSQSRDRNAATQTTKRTWTRLQPTRQALVS